MALGHLVGACVGRLIGGRVGRIVVASGGRRVGGNAGLIVGHFVERIADICDSVGTTKELQLSSRSWIRRRLRWGRLWRCGRATE